MKIVCQTNYDCDGQTEIVTPRVRTKKVWWVVVKWKTETMVKLKSKCLS